MVLGPGWWAISPPVSGPPVGAERKLGRARESHPDHRRHQPMAPSITKHGLGGWCRTVVFCAGLARCAATYVTGSAADRCVRALGLGPVRPGGPAGGL